MDINVSEVHNIETVALPAYTNIRWLLIDLKIVQLSMLQTQHVSVAEGVTEVYITCLSVNHTWRIIHLLHEGLLLIVCYIKQEKSVKGEKTAVLLQSVVKVKTHFRKSVQTSLAHET